jgi:ABC-type Fe3+ transport system permease subunit
MKRIIRMVDTVLVASFALSIIFWVIVIGSMFGESFGLLFGLLEPISESYEGPSMPAWRSNSFFLAGMSGLLAVILNMLSDSLGYFDRARQG